jgi:hypothetical protein
MLARSIEVCAMKGRVPSNQQDLVDQMETSDRRLFVARAKVPLRMTAARSDRVQRREQRHNRGADERRLCAPDLRRTAEDALAFRSVLALLAIVTALPSAKNRVAVQRLRVAAPARQPGQTAGLGKALRVVPDASQHRVSEQDRGAQDGQETSHARNSPGHTGRGMIGGPPKLVKFNRTYALAP